MENHLEIPICRLCLSSVTRENCDVIDEQARDILGIVLPQWNLDEGKHLICNDCSIKLFAAYEFKGTCLNTENYIFPYINFEEGGLLDLREIYLKENDSKLSISEIQNVCRLCMQLIFGEFKLLEQLNVNMLNTFIPEINFSTTENPVICAACYEAFNIHSVFLTICLENEQKFKYVDNGTNYIKTEEVDLKPEETYLKIEGNDNSDLEDTEKECSFEIDNKLQQQSLVPKSASKMKMHECDECSYKTKYKKSLLNHKLIHRDPSEIHMYKCDECSYEAKFKFSLQAHKKIHRDPSEIQMYKCAECSHETRHKKDLPSHMLMHRDPSKVEMLECDECNFKTKYKLSLHTHKKMVHESVSKIQMFQCNECSYKTKYKRSLHYHKLRHRDPSEVPIYNCDECSFKTKNKSYMIRHSRLHRNPSEVQIYKCDECNYKTGRKSHLRSHIIVHKDPSEIQMYKCDECSFETKHKWSLCTHKLRHKNVSERQISVQT